MALNDLSNAELIELAAAAGGRLREGEAAGDALEALMGISGMRQVLDILTARYVGTAETPEVRP